MAKILWEAVVPVEPRGDPGIGAGKSRRNGETGLGPADSLVDVLLIENTVTAAQHGALQKVVGESDTGSEVVVMGVEQLGPALPSRAVASEHVGSGQSAGACIRDTRVHIGQPAERV